ncbi:MAG: UDP-glucose/GDP-mannose dehydrogenase family protein [Candidatus Woesearchaeota archaeon]|nr:UDP-glucose/GDP-mannose dehydrogenase family protein [Candidatus Woesearchaeota archaeon]
MNIAVIGTGYVGLVAGAMFAKVGNHVTCVDINEQIIAQLTAGTIHFFEPGLQEVVTSAVAAGNLHFTTSIADAVPGADITFIAVGTPSEESGAFNMDYVHAAAKDIAAVLQGKKHIVVLKSTVLPSTYTEVRKILGSKVEVVSNPEFLREGRALGDFEKPDRVIIGTESEEVFEKVHSLYAPFLKESDPAMRMKPVSAILTKLFSNTMLYARIALVNEFAQIASAMNADTVLADMEEIRKGMGRDARIGTAYLYPSAGVGGSCFPKDDRALREFSKEMGLDLPITFAVDRSNDVHKLYMPQKVEKHLGSLQGKTIGVWGVAFKARTSDIRESASLAAIDYFLEKGARVRVHDPKALEEAKEHYGDRVTCCDDKYDAVAGADCLVVMTEWDEYKIPDFAKLQELLRAPVIFDGRNIYDPAMQGFTYFGVGRQG